MNKVRNPGKKEAGAKRVASVPTDSVPLACPGCLNIWTSAQTSKGVLTQQQGSALLCLWGKCFLEPRDLLREPPVPHSLLPGQGFLAQWAPHSSQRLMVGSWWQTAKKAVVSVRGLRFQWAPLGPSLAEDILRPRPG